ncbi:MAG: DUF4214 domain-containing protein [Pseudomonadota bacterium]
MTELTIRSRYFGDPFTLTADLSASQFDLIEPGGYQAFMTSTVAFEGGPTLEVELEVNLYDNYAEVDFPGEPIEDGLLVAFTLFEGVDRPGSWIIELDSTNTGLFTGGSPEGPATLADFDDTVEAFAFDFDTITFAQEPVDEVTLGTPGSTATNPPPGASAGPSSPPPTSNHDVPHYVSEIVLLYEAALNRDGAFDTAGLNYWIDQFEAGVSLLDVTFFMTQSEEFMATTGDPAIDTEAVILENIYENVLDRPSDPGGYAYWLGLLESDQLEIHEALFYIAVDTENRIQSFESTEAIVQVEDGVWDVLF